VTTLKEDIELLVETKRVLKFMGSEDKLAAAIDRIESKLRWVDELLEKTNAVMLPHNQFLTLQAQFVITAQGINVGSAVVMSSAPPEPAVAPPATPARPHLSLVKGGADEGPVDPTPCPCCDRGHFTGHCTMCGYGNPDL
jgi:hypothetical protein